MNWDNPRRRSKFIAPLTCKKCACHSSSSVRASELVRPWVNKTLIICVDLNSSAVICCGAAYLIQSKKPYSKYGLIFYTRSSITDCGVCQAQSLAIFSTSLQSYVFTTVSIGQGHTRHCHGSFLNARAVLGGSEHLWQKIEDWKGVQPASLETEQIKEEAQ